MQKENKTQTLVLISFFIALNIILSQITINIGLVPINLTHISIFLAAGILGAKHAGIVQMIYLLLGALNFPVFSNFQGGILRFVGPSGGFLFGYVFCALVSGYLIDLEKKKVQKVKTGKDQLAWTSFKTVCAMIFGMMVTYLCGLCWYVFSYTHDWLLGLTTVVLPFLPGDLIKIGISCAVLSRVNAWRKYGMDSLHSRGVSDH
ncbi:biotin transporter BioY [Clostridia bacterium]|nr:biotin transporter BioY [Clostridia bacterium]